MNKNLLTISLTALLIIGAGLAYVLMPNLSPKLLPSDTEKTTGVTSGVEGGLKSLKDLFGVSVSQKCTYDDQQGNSGVVYAGEQKIKGDFVTKNDQVDQTSHMIKDGKTMYFWVEGETTGYKMVVQDEDQESMNDGTTAQSSLDLDNKVDYNCTPWVSDPSMFVLPGDTEFTDFTQMGMKEPLTPPVLDENTKKSIEESKDELCAACDSAPEDAKIQCRLVIGCN